MDKTKKETLFRTFVDLCGNSGRIIIGVGTLVTLCGLVGSILWDRHDIREYNKLNQIKQKR